MEPGQGCTGVGGPQKHQWGQVVADEERRMTGRVVMVKLPDVFDVAFRTVDPLFQSFENFQVELRVYSLALG